MAHSRENGSELPSGYLVLAVAGLIAAYTEDLVFSQDEDGAFNLSPYDVFLAHNALPKQPKEGESPLAYSRRLLQLIEDREQSEQLVLVSENPNARDGSFEFHDQPFRFGDDELTGLKLFFREPTDVIMTPDNATRGGNCIACHAAPQFTDFRFHNTGTTQEEYDSLHGQGAFAQLAIPALEARNANPDAFLPATQQHPQAAEPFRAVPIISEPMQTDLGLWNIFGNPDFPNPQFKVWLMLCEDAVGQPVETGQLAGLIACQPDRLLSQTIALFKTPGLRDLSHSAPYMHTGQFDSLEDVLAFYRRTSDLFRSNHLRNGDGKLEAIVLEESDITPLAAFLRALNEDYN